jgi:DNA polymerase-1
MKEMIKYEMKNAFKMEVPLDVDWELVKDWLEAH